MYILLYLRKLKLHMMVCWVALETLVKLISEGLRGFWMNLKFSCPEWILTRFLIVGRELAESQSNYFVDILIMYHFVYLGWHNWSMWKICKKSELNFERNHCKTFLLQWITRFQIWIKIWYYLDSMGIVSFDWLGCCLIFQKSQMLPELKWSYSFKIKSQLKRFSCR